MGFLGGGAGIFRVLLGGNSFLALRSQELGREEGRERGKFVRLRALEQLRCVR